MTPELHPLPEPLPATLHWTHTQRRTAWLFDGGTCVGSLGLNGYGRASGVTSPGVWHLHRLGVLHQGVNLAPRVGRGETVGDRHEIETDVIASPLASGLPQGPARVDPSKFTATAE